jgi:hypothetical protein
VIKFTSCFPRVGASPGTPASPTTKTGRHDIAESGVKHQNSSVLQKVLDANMKELLSRGFGTKVKQADPILPEDEEKIWEAQVFGMHSAQILQYTVFFYNCKLFGLHAFDEHRSLECEQFEIGSDNHRKYVHFIGRSNKTFKGGIKQMQLQNKDIKHYCTDGKFRPQIFHFL